MQFPQYHKESEEMSRLLKQKMLKYPDILKLIKEYKRAKDEDKKFNIREEIFNNYIRFIRKEAHRFHRMNPSIEVDDFFNAGVIGFMHSLEKFKVNRKFKFLTYAGYGINQKMQHCMRSNHILKIPIGDYQNHKEEARAHMNDRLIYLDAPLVSDDGANRSYNDIIPDNETIGIEDNLVEELDSKDLRTKLLKVINNKLTIKERTAIREYYFNHKTYKQMSVVMGLTTERVRQITVFAFRRLRVLMHTENLDENVSCNGKNNNGRVFSEEARANISFVKRRLNVDALDNLSKAQQKFSIEVVRSAREMILKGFSYPEIAKTLNISEGTCGKIFKNQLRYAMNAGLGFSKEEQEEVRKLQLTYKVGNFKRGKNGMELQTSKAR